MRGFSSISRSLSVSRRIFCTAPTGALRFYCNHRPAKRAGPLMQYRDLVKQGKLQHDPDQEKVALELENLLGRLQQYEKDMEEYHVKLAEWENRRENERHRLLVEEAEMKQRGDVWASVNKHRSKLIERWTFRGLLQEKNIEPGVGKWVSYLNREKKLDTIVGRRPAAPPAPKGLYLFGNVGSGKTMLMDMFYSATKGIVKHRRRYHFHEAMLEINAHMHQIWKKQVEEKSFQSSISSWLQTSFSLMGKRIKEELAYFALMRFRLLSTGTVLVATSNRAPEDLNQDGMQREIFLKFVDKLREHCDNILIGSEVDYRRLIAQRFVYQNHFFWPLGGSAEEEFQKMWVEITNESGGKIISETIPVMFGRTLEVLKSCNGIGQFEFEYLCGRPVGAADYIAIARNYHTVFISGIPTMSMRIRDKARRFITLIDELYNHHCRLVCSAASSIDDLFKGTEEGRLFDLESFQFETEIEGSKLRRDVLAEGSVSSGGVPTGIISMLSGQEEMFAFRRAVSRLIEMQTPLYLEGVRALHPYFQR
ncbi:AFG1-like ATPase isoform X2 [Punica granatum]|uniref:AFG1-like ATPase isoform X2 n=1 Tax=Punica granatum TaxID=22663 RepID=A0A6P8BRL5_PUNGR|nr:AFG1-like ATPase isoform X2 [Punica granatum]